ncbi:MotA/TolQ/ExbB proton channel family protein [Conexibacter sp. JD483]|uniref:MotA/TolQ/ExbB proton channel family protein n=1 Tax=unclassified Conexibacter TaxID=2627773 RepID=UPI0027234D44|nr:MULTISPECIES: MotA/TolQ/ExbB proton channel family protein [unclassified Conexibacter]MDO8186084.1 MotA/TolQ/ExbB proton channel family protein [Conexibacter sp. CPCC 205706]MDO8199574.1 MotA/TolQ/ExbB proton channel family protein [Conexibacter sp. CPCC 205762]MDR9373019.1 MotA/TolQ/ExbB proton channel family protein [Conexibacter sp. JD483]
MPIPLATIEDVIFDAASALRVPVLLLALVALALVLVELGALSVELLRRRRHDPAALERATQEAAALLGRGDRAAAGLALERVVSGERMRAAVGRMLRHVGGPLGEQGMAKALADFDLESLRRLERPRLLVRAGPALGLMGTLIPLSPALAGLASGDVQELTDNLRVAFSITVLGLMVGAIAFGIALVRDRLYAQDLSDLEYVGASLEPVTIPPTAATEAVAP